MKTNKRDRSPSDDTRPRPTRALVRRKPTLLALEARLMFDGAALATAATALPDAGTDAHTAGPADTTDAAAKSAAATLDRDVAPAGETANSAREIAFIDTTVPDWQQLATAIRPGVEIVLLDPTRDGLAQIADALQTRSALDAIHIVSHGAEGALILAGRSYDVESLGAHQAELTTIGRALTADGDLLLYGCDIGKGSAGERFIESVANTTQADVAASTDTTGAASVGGDWTLEAKTGAIDAAPLLDPLALAGYHAQLSSISLTGNTGWVPVMIGANFDPVGDSQAGAADTDLVGDTTHAAMYVAFDNSGTLGTTSDDYMLFRIRVDNPTSSTNFGGVAIVGVDANLDGRIDLFFAVDGRNNGQRVQLFDPGTGLNNSPSNTTTNPLPSGWLPNNGIYPFSASNYAVTAVSAASDPNWNGDNDLGNDGKTDVFVSFKVPLSDIAAVLAIPSPTDRQGMVGPRGTTGIAGFNANTTVRYVLMSQTQPGPINGDLGGVGANYDKNATFEDLGSFTAPMSPAEPTAAGATLAVSEPVGDGNLSATEDTSVAIAGASTNLADGTSLTITVSDTDGTTPDVTATATVSGNAWSVSGVDLSSLADGTLTITAQTTSGTTVLDTATVQHDRTPPVIAITAGTAYNDTTPTIAGTSDLPAGSVITVTVDPDNDSGTNNSLIYTTTVLAGGGWILDTGVVAPTSGTLPTAGIPSYAKITASGTDAAGNNTTATGLNKPTVNSLTTNDTTPTIGGTWTNIGGDTLSVTVDGTTYTNGSGLTISGNSWSLTTGTLALGTYDVVATVTRAGAGVSDATTGELVIASGPTVTITGGASATDSDTTPTISGTTTLAPGELVLIRVDPNDDGDLSDAITYAVVVGAGGTWSVDTGTATPISGVFPASGITGTAGIHATATASDGSGSADQALTITVPSITTTSVETTATSDSSATVITGDNLFNSREDDAVTVSGTSTNAVGSTVTVAVTDGTSTVSGSGTVASNGAWTVSGLNLSSLKDGNLSVTASVLSVSDTDTVVHDATAPVSYVTTASTIDKTNPVLKGITDLPPGSTLTVTVAKTSDGSAVASGTTTVGTDGRWTWQNAANVIYPTGSNAVTITVTSGATDLAGNKVAAATKVQTVANNFTPPAIAVTSVTGVDYSTGDSTITSAEIGGGVTIAGTCSITSGTVSVTVTDGTTTVSATPGTNGTWSMTLTQAQVQAFKNGTLTVTATVTSGGATATSMYVPQLLLVTGTPTVTIGKPIDNGILNDAEDNSVTVSGTSTNAVGSTVTLTISDADGGTSDVVGTATVRNDGTWSVTGLNLSGLIDGTLTASASVTANGIDATDTAAVLHDQTAPTIGITAGASATDSTPVISGTTDLPAGSTITLTIDPNNDGVLTDQVTYTATVQSGGTWSIDIGTATPTSGALGAGGLTEYAKITASGTDQAGNTTGVTALNRPTVTSLITNDTTPTLSGTWTNLGTDTLSVTVGGTTYTTGSGLSIDGNTWSLTTNALAAATYDVTATATRGGDSISDVTSGELVVDTTPPAIAVTSASVTADVTPVVSGTTDLPAGTVLTVTIDPDNDPGTNNSVIYSVIVQAGGAWSVDTGTAIPASGSFPAAGLAGDVGVSASGIDAAGNLTTATQTLAVDIVPPVIAITTNAMTPDPTPVITGASDLAEGATLVLQIDPNNDGDYADAYTYTLTVGAGGVWSVDTGAVNPDGMGGTVTLSGTVGLKATGSDSVGNATVTTKSLVIDTSAPALIVGAVGDGNISAAEDDAVVIQGSTTDIANGSTLTIYITDGTRTITDTVTVSGNAWAMTPIDLSGLSDGIITVTASYTNLNGDSFTNSASFNHDKTPPTVVLTAPDSAISGAVTVTATFNEAVGGLAADDFAASNGATVSDLVQVDGTTWTFTLTPAVNGTTSVWLPAARVQDAAGNDNTLSGALSFDVNVGVADTIAPTLTSVERYAPTGALTNADSVTFRVTFSENMLGVDTADFALSGAAAAGASVQSATAVAGQPGVYDVVVAGIASANGTLSLALAGSQDVTDAASNALTDATASLSESYTLDNVAPALTPSNGATVSFTTLVLAYDENLAAIAPAAGDFTVMKNGGSAISVTGVAVNTVNNTVTLTLASSVISTDTITVSYTAGGSKTQDLAGNAAANLTNLAVTNATPAADTTAPAAPDLALLASSDSGASGSDRLTNDDTPTVRVTLDGSGASAPVAGDVVKIYLGATQVGVTTLSGADISSGYVDVTTSTLGADGAKSLTATVTDSANNTSAASSALALTLDRTAPALSSAVVDGATLVLTYGEALDGTTAAASDFSVTVNGSAVTPGSVSVNTSAGTVTLTLPSAVGVGDSVSVSYTPGGNPTQDPAGNAAPSLAGQSVANITGDTTPPLLTDIDDGDADDAVAAGDTLSYTVTFNEDIDGTTVTAADFSNAGTAGISIGTITETGPGVFSVPVTTTSAGTLILQVNAGAVIKDAAGNDLNTGGALTDDTTVTVSDTTAPAAPGLALLASSDSGQSATDAVTNDDTPAVRVTLNGTGLSAPVAGDVVRIYSGVAPVGIATLSSADVGNGYVDVTTSTLGADGAKSLTATVTDAYGNASGASGALAIVLDTRAPVLASAGVNGNTLQLTYDETLGGAAPAAADFSVGVNGTPVTPSGIALDTAARTVTLTLPAAVGGGDAVTVSYTPVAGRTQDVAGNAAASLSAYAVVNSTPDTTAPAAPDLALLASSDSGASGSDRLTNDDTPTVRVTLDGSGASAPVAGDVVKIYLGATQVGVTTLSGADISSGYVDVTTSTLGADGAKSLTATVTDSANNTSAASSALALTLDRTAPALVSMDSGVPSGIATVGDTLIYTVTFDEAIDTAAVSAADFSNAGTAVVAINSVTETSPGVFAVSVTATGPGTLQLQINAGTVIRDIAGNGVDTTGAVAGGTSVTVANATTPTAPTEPPPLPRADSHPAPLPPPPPFVLSIDAVPPSTAGDVEFGPFDSQLGLGPTFDRLQRANALVGLKDYAERDAVASGRLLENVWTSSGDNAFRIVVARAEEPSLMVFRGIADQHLDWERAGSFRVPADAFVHTNPRAVVHLHVTLLDGRPLPAWLRFDPTTGKFDGTPPRGTETLSILVIARDSDGREAATIFRIRAEKAHTRVGGGRAGLSEQIRTAAMRERHAGTDADLAHHLRVVK